VKATSRKIERTQSGMVYEVFINIKSLKGRIQKKSIAITKRNVMNVYSWKIIQYII
jgi:hypothetical protein